MMRITSVLILLMGLLLPVFTDQWVGLFPESYICRGSNYIAEIFPPRSSMDSAAKPLCYFYQNTWGEPRFKLLWKDTLVNSQSPVQAIISMSGDLVTIDDYGNSGYEHSVVIYSREGHLVKTYNLDDLIPENDMGEFIHSTSSRWWSVDAKYYFTNLVSSWNPTHLYIKLKWDKVMEFRLRDGEYQYGPISQFPVLDSLNRLSMNSNEYTAVMSTSLRFSSITELLECKSLKGE